MIYEIKPTTQFKKDVKAIKKRGYDLSLIHIFPPASLPKTAFQILKRAFQKLTLASSFRKWQKSLLHRASFASHVQKSRISYYPVSYTHLVGAAEQLALEPLLRKTVRTPAGRRVVIAAAAVVDPRVVAQNHAALTLSLIHI